MYRYGQQQRLPWSADCCEADPLQTGKSCHHSACHVFRMIQKVSSGMQTLNPKP
jgi:hypothetical protein